MEACFGPLGDIADADRCTVCAKHTIGLEIVLGAPDATARYEAQVEARFGPFGDSANLNSR